MKLSLGDILPQKMSFAFNFLKLNEFQLFSEFSLTSKNIVVILNMV